MKTVFITGGSRGIGRALVRAFAKENYRVAFTYLSSHEAALALSKETGALAIRCDAGDDAQMQSAINRALSAFGHLDAVIHNAGTAHTSLVQDMTAEEFDSLYRVHLRGAFLLCKYALPAMISRQSGSVIFISSMWGQVGASCESAYSACKAGLIGFGKALAQEVGPSRVRVNCICPGVIDTDMLAPYSEEDKQALREETPLQRLGTPEDIAASALFLCSEKASFITGQVLGVNGGFVIT
ncbi:MAG: SDR family oxidoreductase [Clostridiales bacterium]|nr:SDR family oxidoreductase [Clostridiales bacterium]